MDPLLDNLTLAPAAQLFELDPPHYTSSYGRRTEAIFKHNVPPAPMLISPDNGLILYERVISTKAEHQLLDKLTKPKYYHPTPSIIRKGGRGGSHCSVAAPAPAPAGGGGSSSASPGPHPRSAARRPSSGSARAPGGRASSSGPDADAGSSSRDRAGSATGGPPSRAGQRADEPHHRTRSFSAGRAGPPGAAPGNHVRRKPLYPEDGPLKDYFSKERASVTATTVFTWGNRYKIGDCATGRPVVGTGGVSMRVGSGADDRSAFSSYMPMQQKPPLRL